MDTFRALVVRKDGETTKVALEDWTPDQLMPGEVTIRCEYSSINYKDGLATRVDGNVARTYPLVIGIDVAGEVLDSTDPQFKPGDKVAANGWDIGVAHHGGLSQLARIPSKWVVALPSGLSTRQAMALGTAGFTAGMSVAALEHMEVTPDKGPVLVTGASGGVGSTAVAMLAHKGYTVAASTGSPEAADFLKSLGAGEIVDRATTTAESSRPLESARWAGGVEAVGGPSLAYLLRTTKVGGSIAISGNVGGASFSSTVYPFILRGVNVLGIDSANFPIEKRRAMWQRLATDLRTPKLEEAIVSEISLQETPKALEAILQGQTRGRVLVRCAD
ncbi:MAG TPA: oxidoreductase [Chloroflexota bacterium]|nr:oxidoreductase [Chloroflexota bacterium]